MAKWRIVKETKGMFHWKAISPDSRGTIRAESFAQAIKNISDLTKEERQPMAKTLADMTAEERQECVGMWCDNLASTADTPQPVVLACVQGDRCWILHTDLHGEWSCFSLDRVAPRFDLPRAWTPDGEPVDSIAAAPELAQALAEETYEYGVEYKYLTNRGAEWRLDPSAGWHKTYRDAERAASAAVQYRIVRRRVSPPEVISE